ncbi:hypothetical protein AK812_SmicGene915 [Symbiodinium microadriaticum]|uniref:Uncharacterized protein n=1 Tax=Symbiodinium microadriaticum TaxID=2951 RepID=A0A1Q9F5C6_SYMMI|nr:hypothetical protein AK812_SmicGene915 [Symbiodinium microadriaticum]
MMRQPQHKPWQQRHRKPRFHVFFAPWAKETLKEGSNTFNDVLVTMAMTMVVMLAMMMVMISLIVFVIVIIVPPILLPGQLAAEVRVDIPGVWS